MLTRAISVLTSAGVLRAIALSGLVGWGIALLIHLPGLRSLTDRHGNAVGGDFIAFYTAGRLITEGCGRRLYDLRLQQAAQRAILGDPGYQGLNSYVNPPAFAAAFVPLALLPYLPAYLLYTVLMFAAALAALRLLKPHLTALQPHWFPVAGLALMFYPIAVTITGGQNTPISLLLLAATYAGLRAGRPLRAGVALGLLAGKPQMALLFGLLLLWRGQWRCLLAAGAVVLGHYLLGAALCGPAWPAEMLAALRLYWPVENHFNGARSISILGLCDYALPQELFNPVAFTAAGLTLAAVLWSWRHARPGDDSFGICWAVGICATIALSPHAQWYEIGLTALAALLALDHLLAAGAPLSARLRAGLMLGYFAPPAYALGPRLGWQPLAFLPLVMLLWLVRHLASAGRRAVRAAAA